VYSPKDGEGHNSKEKRDEWKEMFTEGERQKVAAYPSKETILSVMTGTSPSEC